MTREEAGELVEQLTALAEDHRLPYGNRDTTAEGQLVLAAAAAIERLVAEQEGAAADRHDAETDLTALLEHHKATEAENATLKAERDRLYVCCEWYERETAKRFACVECGLEPHHTSDLYSTVCPSCRRCFSCAEPSCPTCGDSEGMRQRIAQLRAALVQMAIPLEALYASERDGHALCREVKRGIEDAVILARAALKEGTR